LPSSSKKEKYRCDEKPEILYFTIEEIINKNYKSYENEKIPGNDFHAN